MLLFIRPNVEENEEVQICQQDRHALEIEQGDDREHFFALEKAQNNEMLWFASALGPPGPARRLLVWYWRCLGGRPASAGRSPVAGLAAQVQHAPRREVRPVGPTCRAERRCRTQYVGKDGHPNCLT